MVLEEGVVFITNDTQSYPLFYVMLRHGSIASRNWKKIGYFPGTMNQSLFIINHQSSTVRCASLALRFVFQPKSAPFRYGTVQTNQNR
mmetsp:Transcript_17278/g.36123  ORF Transcript_17278/g.36123 Transcript_17278/m.36123 type:complete len:88 (+) Transcript_17278:3267-3530(+)